MKFVYYLLVFFMWNSCSALPKIQSSLSNVLQDDSILESSQFLTETEKNVAREFTEDYNVNNMVLLPTDSITTRRTLDANYLKPILSFMTGNPSEARGKSKLKKIFVPILIFIFIKAITLIPLAIGLLSIKSWNAIQLSFVSFVTTIALAVWKLCSKVNRDEPQPHIYHETYDAPAHLDYHPAAAARNDQQSKGNAMAYNAYPQEKNNITN